MNPQWLCMQQEQERLHPNHGILQDVGSRAHWTIINKKRLGALSFLDCAPRNGGTGLTGKECVIPACNPETCVKDLSVPSTRKFLRSFYASGVLKLLINEVGLHSISYIAKKAGHKELRAPISEIKKAWEKYLGKFKCKTADPNINITVGLTYQAHNANVKRKLCTSNIAPCIDSSSGAKVAPCSDKIILEKDEDST